MTQQNHRKNVWITPETHAQLIAIGRANGAAKGREVSPGIRVAAGYHERLVEALAEAKEFMEVELEGRAWEECRHMAHSINKLLAELDNPKDEP